MTGYQREIIELNKYNHELFMANKKLSYELRIMTEKKEEVIKSVSKETVVNDKSLIVIKNLEKVIRKLTRTEKKAIEDKKEIVANDNKIKTHIKNLEKEIEGYKKQIHHHASEQRCKDIKNKQLEREIRKLMLDLEKALIRSEDTGKMAKSFDEAIRIKNIEVSEAKAKYVRTVFEKKEMQKEIDQLINEAKMKEYDIHELEALKHKLDVHLDKLLVEREEKKKLLEQVDILRKQKTRFIYTGHDTTILLGKVRDSLAKEEKCREDIGMLDCPFFQLSKDLVVKEDKKNKGKEPEIKCGSLTERNYKNKIIVFEHKINKFVKDCKNKYDTDLRLYKESVNKLIYDKNILENKLEMATKMIEDQDLENRFDKIDISLKGSTIKKLKVVVDDTNTKYNTKTTLCRFMRKRYYETLVKKECVIKETERKDKIIHIAGERYAELRNEKYALEQDKKDFETQLSYNKHFEKIHQAELDSLRISIEGFQKKIYKLEEKLNTTNENNDELKKLNEQIRDQHVYDRKIHLEDMREAERQIQILSIENKKLALKNKLFSKKKDNYNKSNLLKTKLMTDKELVYHQNQIKAMKLKKENNFNNERLYETLCPELIQKRIKERVLLKKLIKNDSKKCKPDNQRAKVKKNCR
ncbi:centrosome-associated protein CEP250-like [Rhopalosiphum padi]|uniref:centrosome-associated protein CEP250-like n=1 Tax=Rhopalosiphum padi TaxID=40932 RepID=UPI00298E2435|nr:centrosome-associated protein CEP250-like [Rhopalosiphum padi]